MDAAGSTMADQQFTRRAVLTGGAATAALAVGTGTAAAQAAPDFDGWMSDVGNYEQVTDARGQGEVAVGVGTEGNGGAFAFDPPAVQIDPGTTVVWEWTGEGGGHNVAGMEGATFNSGSPVAEAGTTFEHTFDSEGVFKYQCDPHAALGMKGVVVVGEVPGGGAGGAATPAEADPEEMGVPFQAHYVGIATILMMIVTLIFTFFLLKYGESPHSSHGDR
jgi:halocyanin-like protein